MTENIIITEKPSVAESFASALGCKKEGAYYINNKYVIFYLYGHVFELYEPEDYDIKYKKWNLNDLPIIPKIYKHKTIKKYFGLIKSIALYLSQNKWTRIIIATDAGREGELIARELLDYLKLKDVKNIYRFWTSSALTKDVIIEQLNHLKHISDYDKYYYQALYRQYADWLVGINISRFITLKKNDGILYSFGRVQTAVLRDIVKREEDIKNFVSVPYYKIIINSSEGFKGFYIYNKKTKFFDKSDIDFFSFIKEKCRLCFEESREYVEQPPLLPNLTAVQKIASVIYDYNPVEVLNIMQDLYEEYKLISYPRTSSRYFKSENRQYLIKLYKELFQVNLENNNSVLNRIINDNIEDDHHAVVCLSNDISKISNNVKCLNVYNIIRDFMKKSIMSPYRYKITSAMYKGLENEYIFYFKEIQDWGWKKNEDNKKTNDEDNSKEDVDIHENILTTDIPKTLNVIAYKIENKFTTPPCRYKYSSILTHMEKNKLGTEATRAYIIDILFKRGYVINKKKEIIPMSKAYTLIEFIDNVECELKKLTYTEYTREMEESLLQNPYKMYEGVVSLIKNIFQKR